MPEELKPQIAIVTSNVLEGLGLQSIIEKMIPAVVARLFSSFSDMEKTDSSIYYHFFISTDILMENAEFFIHLSNKTMVLINGKDSGSLPTSFHTLNTRQSESSLIRDIMHLAGSSHSPKHTEFIPNYSQTKKPILTKRETDVLRLIIKGHINKEIATILNVGLTTVISHRKHITEKLQIKSVSGLTIYGVTRGIVRPEDI